MACVAGVICISETLLRGKPSGGIAVLRLDYGHERLTNRGLNWYDHPFFLPSKSSRHEDVGAKAAGRWKGYGPLKYVEAEDSGHLVPYAKPEEALTLINSQATGSAIAH